jgi:hypothetical protein
VSTTKEHVNAAHKRVQQIDQKLGKLVHQVAEARVRALDAATKAGSWKSAAVPIDAPIERHMAAAGESGNEYAVHEGQRKYWAGFHLRLLPELIATREEAVKAELDCVEAARQFWDDRFTEQARAFFSRNEDVLRDIYGSLSVMRRHQPTLEEFWTALLVHAPQNDHTGNPAVYLPGVKAAERILPPPPVAENLRPDERNAVRAAMNGFVNEAHQRVLATVGIDASASALDTLRERDTSIRRMVQKTQERLVAIPREVEDAKRELKEAVRVGAPGLAGRLQATIAELAAEVQSKTSAIRDREAELLEIADDIAAIELERAKLAAVEL